jgi:hypothetical protein
MLYLMSTTVIPHGADGVWHMATISTGQAIELAATTEHTSAVGHESSAEAMSAALGAPVAANRLTVCPAPSDQFLCMRLHRRPPEGVILDRAALDQIGFSWALMTYHG